MKGPDDFTMDEALSYLRSDAAGARAWCGAFAILLAEGLDFSARPDGVDDEGIAPAVREAYERRRAA